MAITPPTTPVATSIPIIKVTLYDRLETEDEPASQGANYQLVVIDQNGRRFRWGHEQGNAVPHLTTAERNYLMAFLTSFRARSEGEVLP